MSDTAVAPRTPPAPVAFLYTQTDSFVALLTELSAALVVSTYQAIKLLVVRACGQGLSTLEREKKQRAQRTLCWVAPFQ